MANFHNTVRYGLTRKREQYSLWQPSGNAESYDAYGDQSRQSGDDHRRQWLLRHRASGARLCAIIRTSTSLFPTATSSFTKVTSPITPHLAALIGFHYEDERGLEKCPSYGTHDVTERNNYDYLALCTGTSRIASFTRWAAA